MLAAELLETQAPSLPSQPSVTTLQELRETACSQASKFKLQSHQRFLRRILSPDTPVRNLLMVHGTGVGKSCSAIQIAEEYIMRPEYREHKVLILANPAVVANFRREIFSIDRTAVDRGRLVSTQCTGRRYLEMLERVEGEPARWSEPEVRERLTRLADRILDEFYEFMGYTEFAKKVLSSTPQQIREEFNNRLLIVDEVHNIRSTDGEKTEASKIISAAFETLVKTAEGLVLVCLTATPMYDSYSEILFYYDLFLWNDRRQPFGESLAIDDFFKEDGTLRPEVAEVFRGWTQDYVSFVRGGSPFTFPFRLPPPEQMVAKNDRKQNPQGKPIPARERRKYLDKYLVENLVQGPQQERLRIALVGSPEDLLATVAVPPEPIRKDGKQFAYGGEPWLTPSKLPQYAAKFATVLKCIREGKGISMVYSNYVDSGTRLFAMALEEAGYKPLVGSYLLSNPAHEDGIKPGSAGTYTLITQDTSDTDLRRILMTVKQSDNRDGGRCRVIVASPRVSEGVDFRFVRQIHVLDPWFNMSRLEQVMGRGMRTCSHTLLPPEEQNCTVYFHICRFPEPRECIDEFIYRRRVEAKAIQIANVRRVLMESAMDCSLQLQVNSLPLEWSKMPVPQIRAQDGKRLNLSLGEMLTSPFEMAAPLACQIKDRPPSKDHVRPLSTYLDVRDEVFDELQKKFHEKPVWLGDELRAALPYQADVVTFLLQDAVRSSIRFSDPQDRPSVLQSRGAFYALTPVDGTGNETLVQRIVDMAPRKKVVLPEVEEAPVEAPAPEAEKPADYPNVTAIANAYHWPEGAAARFSQETREDFVVDAVLTSAQRRALLSGPSNRWTERIEARIDSERVLRILGPKEFLVGTTRIETPIDEVGEAYQRWLEERKRQFLDDLNVNSATYVEGEGLKIWTFELEDGIPVRKTKLKSIGPTVAKTIKNPLVDGFARWLDPAGIPPKLKSRDDRIPYLHLMIRQAGPEKVRWWTPEEWAVLDSERASIRARMSEK